ncbi:MAG TPA: class I SAM-dependent methyltransferase [Desulfatiglandales bacterium]|nr:class I SAM-dependent methyltransferase [Desulfatiglandales bacterium]
MPDSIPYPLLDPVDGRPLRRIGEYLISSRGRRYWIQNGVIDILDKELMDPTLDRELKTFENIPIEKVCYFRPVLMRAAVGLIKHILNRKKCDLSCVEIGGGEGYFAKAFKDEFPGGVSYVCDLSMRHLKNAAPYLNRIRCDVRRPYLAPECVDVAAFWVSLHHFNKHKHDMEDVLFQARNILRPRGVLVLFEPSMDFLPRRILLASSLKRLVYFDKEEKALRYKDLSNRLNQLGFQVRFVTGHNPPYNLEFMRKFRLGILFFLIAESFYQIERLIILSPRNWWSSSKKEATKKRMPLMMGSYFFSILTLESKD